MGSPRTHKSTSHSLGAYLMEQLAERGIETETFHVYTVLNSPEDLKTLFAQVISADLTVLAFPLYVDTLPAPVIERLGGCVHELRHGFLPDFQANRAETPRGTAFKPRT